MYIAVCIIPVCMDGVSPLLLVSVVVRSWCWFLVLLSILFLRQELSLDLGFPGSSRLDKVSGSSCQYPPVPHCRLMLQHQAFTRTLGIQTQFPYL